jgi:riboflavin biosynthesis pyrimidine reductase
LHTQPPSCFSQELIEEEGYLKSEAIRLSPSLEELRSQMVSVHQRVGVLREQARKQEDEIQELCTQAISPLMIEGGGTLNPDPDPDRPSLTPTVTGP